MTGENAKEKIKAKLQAKKKYLLILLMLACLAGIACYLFSAQTEPMAGEAAKTRVKTMTIGESQNAATSYAGEIRSQYESELSFMTSGKVVKRYVKNGDKVKAGDILAVLDTRDLEQSVRSAQAQNETARSALELAEKNLSRYKILYQQGAISQMDFDKVAQEYDAASARVRETNAQVASSQNQLGYSSLVADRDGIITRMDINAGKVVEAGETVAAIADEHSLEAVFEVPEDMVKNIYDGMNVDVSCNGQSYQGTVHEIASMADTTTRTFKIKAILPDTTGLLRLGMTAQVNLPDALSAQGIFIPRTAIVEQDNGSGVWLEQNGKIKFQAVTLANAKDDEVEVTSGLQAGDVIVTAGVQKLYDGEDVEVMDK